MNHEIKALAEAITNGHTKSLVQSHVKELRLENEHLTIFVDNAGPLNEFLTEDIDHHLKSGLEKVYDPEITYELKLYSGEIPHEREKQVPHNIHQ